MQQVKVLLPIQQMGALDYLLPPEILASINDLVIVPFRNKKLVGIIYAYSDTKIALEKLKKIETKLDLPPIACSNLEFIKWVAEYNLIPLGNMVKMLLPIPQIFNDKNLANYKAIKYESKVELPELSQAQNEAFKNIKERSGFNPIILEGVTGSGKTEVYFSQINEVLKLNQQALILLPEITLTAQITKRFTERFGFIPAEWHSDLTIKEKKKIWLGVLHGDIKLIIGARSALFLPFQNLKLIVVDEEHDQSYKQEEGNIYHARDMAIVRASIEKIPIILASATPSLESLYNYKQKKYDLIDLPSRYGGASLPEIKVIDMRKLELKGEWISLELKNLIKENLARQKQTILFLNRRGYAPLTICRSCGYRLTCPSCSTWLVEHRGINRLKCHHCGYNEVLAKVCPECQVEGKLAACGPGVERIYEEVTKFLPEAKLAMMTGDLIDNKEASSELINKILSNEVDIIIGTQMIAKGLHFPNITLVGIIDADLGLAGGDLRASERTYQLLAQVSGRAGREKDKGLVVLQSYNPENSIIKSLTFNQTKEFLLNELDSRESCKMPPFIRLAALIFSSEKEDKVKDFITNFVKLAPYLNDVEILGPAPALIYKLRGKYRYRVLLKAKRNFNVQNYIRRWIEKTPKIPHDVQMKIDIDPYNFF